MSHPKYRHIGDPATRVVEECSEVINEICKAQRFGWHNHHPDEPHRTNMERIRAEMDDVIEAFEALEVYFRHLNYDESHLTRCGL